MSEGRARGRTNGGAAVSAIDGLHVLKQVYSERLRESFDDWLRDEQSNNMAVVTSLSQVEAR